MFSDSNDFQTDSNLIAKKYYQHQSSTDTAANSGRLAKIETLPATARTMQSTSADVW